MWKILERNGPAGSGGLRKLATHIKYQVSGIDYGPLHDLRNESIYSIVKI